MKIHTVPMCKNTFFLRRLKIVFLLGIGLVLVFSSPGWCRSYAGSSERQSSYERRDARGNSRLAQADRSGRPRVRGRSSSGDTRRLRNREKQWEQMSPRKQEELRHRMDRFKSMPPDERRLYRKRYEQLQQLPPEQQQDIRSKLRRMDRLSPEEKEEIRRRFE